MSQRPSCHDSKPPAGLGLIEPAFSLGTAIHRLHVTHMCRDGLIRQIPGARMPSLVITASTPGPAGHFVAVTTFSRS